MITLNKLTGNRENNVSNFLKYTIMLITKYNIVIGNTQKKNEFQLVSSAVFSKNRVLTSQISSFLI